MILLVKLVKSNVIYFVLYLFNSNPNKMKLFLMTKCKNLYKIKIDSGKNIVKSGSNIMSTNVILHGINICTNEFKTG